MNFRVEMSTDYAERILRHGGNGQFPIKYGEQSGPAFHADREATLSVETVHKINGGNAGKVIEIRGWIADESGRREVLIRHSSAYGPKGTTIMREL